MTTDEYLSEILASQVLATGSDELNSLIARRNEVEDLLRSHLQSGPTIRYGGSRAKGTMIRENYDLDLICYLSHDSTGDGETLEQVYDRVRGILATEYFVQPKRSALRIKSAQDKTDFHVDVVPGRFVDDSKSDAFLYQSEGAKRRLKTNLQTHIDHIKSSGVVEAIRLIKLWKTRRLISIKQFVLELVVIELLASAKSRSLEEQLGILWSSISERDAPPAIKDPANPNGNDLSEILDAMVWSELRIAASLTLSQVEEHGLEFVFGPVPGPEDSESRATKVQRAAAAVVQPTAPWSA